MIGGLACSGYSAGDDDVLPHIAACVDAREHEVRPSIQREERQAHAVRGCAVNGVTVLTMGFNLEWLMRGDTVAAHALLLGWGHNHPLPAKLQHGLLQSLQARSVDAIIIR